MNERLEQPSVCAHAFVSCVLVKSLYCCFVYIFNTKTCYIYFQQKACPEAIKSRFGNISLNMVFKFLHYYIRDCKEVICYWGGRLLSINFHYLCPFNFPCSRFLLLRSTDEIFLIIRIRRISFSSRWSLFGCILISKLFLFQIIVPKDF